MVSLQVKLKLKNISIYFLQNICLKTIAIQYNMKFEKYIQSNIFHKQNYSER